MRKHRQFTPEFKAELVLAVLTGLKTQAEVCGEHQIKPQVITHWKRQLIENAYRLFQCDEQHSVEQMRIAELEQILGRKTFELETAKQAFSILRLTMNE